MKNLQLIIIMLFLSTTSFAQKKVAVFSPKDESSTNMGEIISEIFSTTIINSAEYVNIERAVIEQTLNKNNYRSTAQIEENSFSELGNQMGADYVCVSIIKKMGADYFITAKLINVASATVEKQEYIKTINGGDDLFEKVEKLSMNLFGTESIVPSSTLKPILENSLELKQGTFTDVRDSISYKYVTIGNQIWMAENLNYSKEGRCYDRDDTNGEKYGRLYTIKSALHVCPNGWHLPSMSEWEELVYEVGGYDIAGRKLKSKSGWNAGGNGSDEYGFNALSSGVHNNLGKSKGIGQRTRMWSSDVEEGSEYYTVNIYYDIPRIKKQAWGSGVGYSVRCIKN